MSAPSLEPPYGARDAHDMAGRIAAIPQHIRDALGRSSRNPWRLPVREPALLAMGGMGGSAIAGELTAALVADRAPRPLLVTRGDRWPAYVNASALALLSSYSGETAETLSLYREAAERRVPRVALTTGGTLEKWCDRDEAYVHRVPGGSPPRAALFTVWVPVTRLVHALGWCDDMKPAWEEAAALLERRTAQFEPGTPEERNPAKQLARALHGRFVLVYSAGGPTAAAGTRWRQQVNENAKLLAHAASVPELNHNEIVGWERPGEFHSYIGVVLLRDAEDSADAALRLQLTAEDARRAGAETYEVLAEGDSRLARIASLVQLGDWVSLYLALLNGADPTPIPSIDAFKRRLAEAGEHPHA